MPNDDPPVSVACSLASLSCSLLLFTHTLGCSRRFVSVVFEPRSLSVACGKEKATTTIITRETTTRTSVLNYARFYIKWSFIYFFLLLCFLLLFFSSFSLWRLSGTDTLTVDICFCFTTVVTPFSFFLFPRLCVCAPFLFSVLCPLSVVRSVVCLLLSSSVCCCPSVNCG